MESRRHEDAEHPAKHRHPRPKSNCTHKAADTDTPAYALTGHIDNTARLKVQ